MGLKLVIADPKQGKCLQKELEDSKFLVGMKIGDTFKGENVDLTGYEFQITGGSDAVGFPMRKDVEGSVRAKILATEGVGLRKKRKGQRSRKTVAGGTISVETAQVNVKVIEEGSQSLFEEPKAEEPEVPAEEAAPKEAEEAPKEEAKEESKEEPKAEETKEAKEAPEEKPAEESKEQEVPEEKKE